MKLLIKAQKALSLFFIVRVVWATTLLLFSVS